MDKLQVNWFSHQQDIDIESPYIIKARTEILEGFNFLWYFKGLSITNVYELLLLINKATLSKVRLRKVLKDSIILLGDIH